MNKQEMKQNNSSENFYRNFINNKTKLQAYDKLNVMHVKTIQATEIVSFDTA